MAEKVLVTGATGFLGQHLAAKLHRIGYEVTATGRSKAKGAALEKMGIIFIHGELADKKRMTMLCKNKDYVIHCGAFSSAWGKYSDFYTSNVIGTQHIVEGCKANQVGRLIHISTPSLYSTNQDRFQVSELDPLPAKQINAYAATKFLAEQEVNKASASGLPVITLRPRAIFGPGDQAILPRLIAANKRGRLPFIAGGKALIDATYIGNAVDAVLQSMSAPNEALGQQYNITNGEPIPFAVLVQRLFERMDEPVRSKQLSYYTAYAAASVMEGIALLKRNNKEPLLTRSTVGMLGRSLTLNISAARNMIGYKPIVTIDEGIDSYVQWIKQHSQTV